MRDLYDWPIAIAPSRAILISPSHTIDGKIGFDGFETNFPTGGSRNQMRLEFATRESKHGNWVSWVSSLAKSALWRIPVAKTPQLATSPEIIAGELQFQRGIPFSTNQPFSTGYGFKYSPSVTLVDSVLEGNIELKLDMTNYPNALKYGNVFGLGRTVHHVDDIEYEGNIAHIKCRPPFRRNYDADSLDQFVTLRPSMIGMMQNPQDFVALFGPVGLINPGSAVFNEVVDERFL